MINCEDDTYEIGGYGYAMITKGKYKGHVAYIDDDCGVYLYAYLGPWADGFVKIKDTSVRPATKKEINIHIHNGLGVSERY